MTESAIDELAARAAKKAGEWWAKRLDPAYQDKAEAFAEAVERHTYQALTGQTVWDLYGNARVGDGNPIGGTYVKSDNEPKGPLLQAVIETIDPTLQGILPCNTELFVTRERLRSTEGYCGRTEEIKLA